MKRILEDARQKLAGLVLDDSGADLVEYALLAALIAVGSVAVLEDFGKKHLLKELTTITKTLKKTF